MRFISDRLRNNKTQTAKARAYSVRAASTVSIDEYLGRYEFRDDTGWHTLTVDNLNLDSIATLVNVANEDCLVYTIGKTWYCPFLTSADFATILSKLGGTPKNVMTPSDFGIPDPEAFDLLIWLRALVVNLQNKIFLPGPMVAREFSREPFTLSSEKNLDVVGAGGSFLPMYDSEEAEAHYQNFIAHASDHVRWSHGSWLNVGFETTSQTAGDGNRDDLATAVPISDQMLLKKVSITTKADGYPGASVSMRLNSVSQKLVVNVGNTSKIVLYNEEVNPQLSGNGFVTMSVGPKKEKQGFVCGNSLDLPPQYTVFQVVNIPQDAVTKYNWRREVTFDATYVQKVPDGSVVHPTSPIVRINGLCAWNAPVYANLNLGAGSFLYDAFIPSGRMSTSTLIENAIKEHCNGIIPSQSQKLSDLIAIDFGLNLMSVDVTCRFDTNARSFRNILPSTIPGIMMQAIAQPGKVAMGDFSEELLTFGDAKAFARFLAKSQKVEAYDLLMQSRAINQRRCEFVELVQNVEAGAYYHDVAHAVPDFFPSNLLPYDANVVNTNEFQLLGSEAIFRYTGKTSSTSYNTLDFKQCPLLPSSVSGVTTIKFDRVAENRPIHLRIMNDAYVRVFLLDVVRIGHRLALYSTTDGLVDKADPFTYVESTAITIGGAYTEGGKPYIDIAGIPCALRNPSQLWERRVYLGIWSRPGDSMDPFELEIYGGYHEVTETVLPQFVVMPSGLIVNLQAFMDYPVTLKRDDGLEVSTTVKNAIDDDTWYQSVMDMGAAANFRVTSCDILTAVSQALNEEASNVAEIKQDFNLNIDAAVAEAQSNLTSLGVGLLDDSSTAIMGADALETVRQKAQINETLNSIIASAEAAAKEGRPVIDSVVGAEAELLATTPRSQWADQAAASNLMTYVADDAMSMFADAVISSVGYLNYAGEAVITAGSFIGSATLYAVGVLGYYASTRLAAIRSNLISDGASWTLNKRGEVECLDVPILQADIDVANSVASTNVRADYWSNHNVFQLTVVHDVSAEFSDGDTHIGGVRLVLHPVSAASNSLRIMAYPMLISYTEEQYNDATLARDILAAMYTCKWWINEARSFFTDIAAYEMLDSGLINAATDVEDALKLMATESFQRSIATRAKLQYVSATAASLGALFGAGTWAFTGGAKAALIATGTGLAAGAIAGAVNLNSNDGQRALQELQNTFINEKLKSSQIYELTRVLQYDSAGDYRFAYVSKDGQKVSMSDMLAAVFGKLVLIGVGGVFTPYVGDVGQMPTFTSWYTNVLSSSTVWTVSDSAPSCRYSILTQKNYLLRLASGAVKLGAALVATATACFFIRRGRKAKKMQKLLSKPQLTDKEKTWVTKHNRLARKTWFGGSSNSSELNLGMSAVRSQVENVLSILG